MCSKFQLLPPMLASRFFIPPVGESMLDCENFNGLSFVPRAEVSKDIQWRLSPISLPHCAACASFRLPTRVKPVSTFWLPVLKLKREPLYLSSFRSMPFAVVSLIDEFV